MEILAPCGGKESFFTAINNGANGVYLGLDNFSARKNADNFNVENISYYIAYAHLFNVKVYVCVNTLIKDLEMGEFVDTVEKAYLAQADAFIVQDVFLGKTLKNLFPEICLHLSTQAGVCNLKGAEIAKDYGFSRVVVARETPVEEISKISKIIETEVFVHGALCSGFSGHCYFSSVIGGNSGNRGLCRQPCRQKYAYSFNNKPCHALSLSDLCLVDKLEELKNAGVCSLKIEGRMRSAEYVGSTVSLYKKALLGKDYKRELALSKRAYNRGDFTSGYVFGEDKNILSTKVQGHLGEFVGKVETFKKGKIKLNKQFLIGCGFKILRDGIEVGSGKIIDEKNLLSYSGSVALGDDIYITKDLSIAGDLEEKLVKEFSVEARFMVGERAMLTALGKTVYSSEILQEARSIPLDKKALFDNLQRVDLFPFKVTDLFLETNGVFISKAELNKLRKAFFESIFYGEQITKPVNKTPFDLPKIERGNGQKALAVISSFPLKNHQEITHFVFAPNEYNKGVVEEFLAEMQSFKGEKYLYIPCFLTDSEIEKIKTLAHYFVGFYVEGIFGVKLAKECGVKCFGGIELNVFNKIDQAEIMKVCDYYCHSKELSLKEFEPNGFVFTLGSIKLMSLIYCPNGRNCKGCNVSNLETLTDYGSRVFPVRRYKTSNCRFEVFNQNIMCSKKYFDKMIFDFTGLNQQFAQELFNVYLTEGFKGVSSKFKCTQYSLNNGIN